MIRFIIYKKKLLSTYILIIFATIIFSNILFNLNAINAYCYNKSEIDMKPIIEEIYQSRSKVFVTGDLLKLKPLFDLSNKYGKWSLEHEVRRVKYLFDWSQKREVKFTNVESSVRIKRIYKKGDIFKCYLEESYKFDYIYTHDEAPKTNSFGVGLRHTLTLANRNDKWLIYSDWYTDCFEDAMGAYSGLITTPTAISIPTVPNLSDEVVSQHKTSKRFYGYNRQKAVEYADKYCGTAWGSGNNYKYNNNYNDYNGRGGDCTNFASQVLSDQNGGGLKKNSFWHSGTHAWSNVNGLKDYILYNGKGYVIGKGTYEELTKQTQNTANGILSKLKLGDLVCYVKNKDPNHFAVVTGIDSHGYPLVNSHTTDRYHVPWDLGWGNKNITFVLIHMNG